MSCRINFLETQFPADISYGATGGPTYSTDVVTMFSGHEQRNSNWSKPKAKYNIATGVKTEAQWRALISFFRVCKGKAIGLDSRIGAIIRLRVNKLALVMALKQNFS